MSFVTRFMTVSMLAAAVFAAAPSVRAEETADGLFAQAQELYAARDIYNVADQNASNEKAIKLLEKAEALVTDDDSLKYDVLILEARALYWRGMNVVGNEENNDAKVPVFDAARAKAQAAIDLDGEYAEGYYYAGIALSRWGLAKGVLNALKQTGKLLDLMDKTIARDTKDGTPGLEIDGYGPNRVIGRLRFKLPPGLGRDNDESLSRLKAAYEKAPTLALNAVYYAQTLAERFKKKDEARAILNQLLAGNPETFNESRVPETKLEFEEARELLKKLN